MHQSAEVLFLSHGGGPLPLLGDPGHAEMRACLEHIASLIQRPSAILVISAHWEASAPTVTASASPSLIYDYSGFPPESYQISYPCPGDVGLANQVYEQLKFAGFDAARDEQRGLDHGVFVPLKMMFPDADIPCVQLSLLKHLDPETHLRLGEALQGLAQENLLIIGSGFSFHNMRAFFAPETDTSVQMNQAFEAWLEDTCSNPGLSESERRNRLLNWGQAPGARFCHPREEHLLPLHVCYGATGRACSDSFQLRILGKLASMYLWRAE